MDFFFCIAKMGAGSGDWVAVAWQFRKKRIFSLADMASCHSARLKQFGDKPHPLTPEVTTLIRGALDVRAQTRMAALL
jgi:hypothetical protein